MKNLDKQQTRDFWCATTSINFYSEITKMLLLLVILTAAVGRITKKVTFIPKKGLFIKHQNHQLYFIQHKQQIGLGLKIEAPSFKSANDLPKTTCSGLENANIEEINELIVKRIRGFFTNSEDKFVKDMMVEEEKEDVEGNEIKIIKNQEVSRGKQRSQVHKEEIEEDIIQKTAEKAPPKAPPMRTYEDIKEMYENPNKNAETTMETYTETSSMKIAPPQAPPMVPISSPNNNYGDLHREHFHKKKPTKISLIPDDEFETINYKIDNNYSKYRPCQ